MASLPSSSVRVLCSAASLLLAACSGSGTSVDGGDPGTGQPPLDFSEVRRAPLFGSLGNGSGTTRDEAVTADPYSVAALFAASGNGNRTALSGTIDTLGLPTAAAGENLRGRSYAPPAQWPPASAGGTPGAVPATLAATDYAGAFEPGMPAWTENWTLALDGRVDTWGFFGFNAAPGTALGVRSNPGTGGSPVCPEGTTLASAATGATPFSARFGSLSADELRRFPGLTGDYDVCVLPSRLVIGSLVLTNDNVYQLADTELGTVIGAGNAELGNRAPNPVTVCIEPGTLIFGKNAQSLVITRGSRVVTRVSRRARPTDPLDCNPTAVANSGVDTAPVTFTSEAQLRARFDGDPATDPAGSPGQWGGVVLMGRAPVAGCQAPNCNLDAGDGLGFFGGSMATDASSDLAYTVIRNAGALREDGSARPALRLLGTGRGSLLDRVQVHASGGDAVAVRGGQAFLLRTALTASGGAALTWDAGWTGGAQFLFALAASATRGVALDGRAADVAPPSFPLLANISVLGPATEAADSAGQALRLSGGTRLQLHNSLLTGSHRNGCLDLDDDATFARAAEAGGTPPDAPGPHLLLRNSLIDCLPFHFNENG